MSVQLHSARGPIDAAVVKEVMGAVSDPRMAEVTGIRILISSYGGDVAAGLALCNILKAVAVPITTHAVGNVASMALAIYLQGKKRLACPHSVFLMHGISWNLNTQVDLRRAALNEALSYIDRYEEHLVDIIASATKLKPNDVKAAFLAGDAWSPDTALTHGVVHEIVDL